MIIYLKMIRCNISKLIIKFQKEKSFNPLKRSFSNDHVHLKERALSKPSN